MGRKEVEEVKEVGERRDVRVEIGWTRGGCTPGFWGKSAEDVGRMVDRCDTENERVRKYLKSKRRDWEKRERKCRRADILRGVHPPVFV
jgi:hypothetical protein